MKKKIFFYNLHNFILNEKAVDFIYFTDVNIFYTYLSSKKLIIITLHIKIIKI